MNTKLTLDTPVKFLRSDLSAPWRKVTWKVGDWMPPIQGELVPCQNGYHYTTIRYWNLHYANRMFLITPAEETIECDTKQVCRTAILTAEVTNWNQKNLSLFAADCAERVAHVCADPRVMAAIMAAIVAVRDYWAGKIGREELNVAAAAVDDVARVGCARAADAADAAAYAVDVAYGANPAAAREAAAAYAADAAADAAADTLRLSTAYAAEREWQANRLLQYLNGEV